MIRILHIFYNMGNGGVERTILDYYRHIDRDLIQFDFLTSVEEKGYFDELIQSLGGRLLHAYPLKKNPIRNFKDVVRIVRENNYSIVERHTGSAFGYYELRAAKRGGAKRLILHAHNNGVGKPFLHQFSKLLLRLDCSRFACSQDAGNFLFGKNSNFEIVHNAIDTDKFIFRPSLRSSLRKSLNLDNKLVIGHVGRFDKQKNHTRLLDIFSRIRNRRDDAVLVCVGAGKLENEVRSQIKSLGLTNSVLLLGQRNDVDELFNAFDLFLLPSIYEGLGIVLLEAQANGLTCFASKNVIPPEVDVTGNVKFIPLSTPSETWADTILQNTLSRDAEAYSKLNSSGYNIATEANKLQRVYLSMLDHNDSKR